MEIAMANEVTWHWNSICCFIIMSTLSLSIYIYTYWTYWNYHLLELLDFRTQPHSCQAALQTYGTMMNNGNDSKSLMICLYWNKETWWYWMLVTLSLYFLDPKGVFLDQAFEAMTIKALRPSRGPVSLHQRIISRYVYDKVADNQWIIHTSHNILSM